MSFLGVSYNALLPRGRHSNDKRMISEESMECNILASSSHHSSHHSALLVGSECSSHYGAKESTECDIMVSDTNSASRSKSGSSSSASFISDLLSKDRVWIVALCTLIVCLASLLNGMMLGFSSPVLTQLQFNVSEEYRISDKDIKFSLFAVSVAFICLCTTTWMSVVWRHFKITCSYAMSSHYVYKLRDLLD